jgi:cold shock CspA family protein/ribosome-associated translation inhibitor RaiA
MQVPPKITFANFPPSPALEARIHERIEALEHFFPDIVACRVAVESDARQHRQGKLYNVHVVLTVPGRDIVVNRDHPANHAHEDPLVAIRDAFDAARRQLEDYVRKMKGATKTHEAPTRGHITRLFPDYAFIQSEDGQEIYMHRNALVGSEYDELAEGDVVRYALHEGEGAKGPQASTVVREGKRR